MPTQNVNLSAEQVEFIKKSIHEGGFRNASEVIRAGLRLLETERQENSIKLKALRSLVKDGFDAIDAGDYELVTQENLAEFLESIAGPKRGRKTA